MRLAGVLFLLAGAGLLTGCGTLQGRRPLAFDAGPVAAMDTAPGGMSRVRAVGPLIERRSDEVQSFTAVRPFTSRMHDATVPRSSRDILWPWGMVKQWRGETDWRFFPAFGHDFDHDDPESRYRWAVFPVLFGGRSAEGDGYFAVFPLGGTLREFIGRDRIRFVLFPLYVKSEINELTTHTVLWPVFSRTRGPGVERFRVFPFYGMSTREGQWTKRFVLWPFWTSVRYHHTDSDQDGGFVLFPLVGRIDVEERSSRMLLPPFFKLERAPGHWALNCPWPFVRLRRGDVHRTAFWPLWGRRVIGGRESGFYAWPIGSWERIDRVDHTVRIRRVAPFWYSEVHQAADASDQQPPAVRKVKLWPLFGYRREDDVSRLRIPELWPLRDMDGIERNWAPLWSLVRRSRHGDERETELLWGLYRRRSSGTAARTSVFPLFSVERDAAADARRWSVLGGALGYAREGVDKQVQLLYLFKVGRP